MTDDLAARAPVAEKRPTVFEAHGVARTDEYAWLRDADDPCVLEYLRAERDHYDRVCAHLIPLRGELADEMTSRTPAADSSISWRRGARVYYTRTGHGEEYDSLYLIESPDAAGRVLLDAAALAGGGHLELGLVEPSPDGRWLAYSVDRTGEEVYELRFRDVATGEDLADVVPRSYYTGAWSADSTAFLYTVPDEAYRPDRVRLHRLGSPASSDVTVVEEPDQRFELTVAASRDGGSVLVTATSRDTTEVVLLDAADPTGPPRVVAPRRPGIEYAAEVLPGGWDGAGEDRLLIVTNDGRTEFRLVEAPVPPAATGDLPGGGASSWREVRAAAGPPGERLVAAHVIGRHVVLEVRRDGEPLLRVLDRLPGSDGRRATREIRAGLPAGQLRLWRADDPDAGSLVVVEQNLVTAPAWIEVDLATGARTVRKRAEVPGVDPDWYVTERILVPSTGGVSVPVTIARRRDLAPGDVRGCLLYGYGAYESCVWPEHAVPTLSLLDRGVVYAVAHVRGGGEGGRRWWLDGRLRAKQHTCDDFLAARDGLVAAGLAGPRGAVVGRGLSAGGLLQGMAFSQAPAAWAGIVAEVPFVDVVTSMSDPSIPLTVAEWDEWGNPVASAEDFGAMLAYSPYDNPPSGPRPPLLVTGALHDPRVLVHEPAKWVARLRATDDAGSSAVVFRVELGEGAHSGPTGRFALLHYEAEIYAWVLEQLDRGPRPTPTRGG